MASALQAFVLLPRVKTQDDRAQSDNYRFRQQPKGLVDVDCLRLRGLCYSLIELAGVSSTLRSQIDGVRTP